METTQVTAHWLEITGKTGCTNPLRNSSETPHGGNQPNSHRPQSITPPGAVKAEKQPKAKHAHRKAERKIPTLPQGKTQRPSLHAITQHKPLGDAVVPVKKGQ